MIGAPGGGTIYLVVEKGAWEMMRAGPTAAPGRRPCRLRRSHVSTKGLAVCEFATTEKTEMHAFLDRPMTKGPTNNTPLGAHNFPIPEHQGNIFEVDRVPSRGTVLSAL